MRGLAGVLLLVFAAAGLADDRSDWSAYGRTANEQRFSPLEQINTTTVTRLGLAWTQTLEHERGVETTPLVIDGVMYMSNQAGQVEARDPGNGKVITTFVFRVRNIPAALYKAMGGFATNGVNMTKLESYMVGGNFFATQFYADVEGHPDDTALVHALEELAFFSKELTVLGVYPAHAYRETFSEETD